MVTLKLRRDHQKFNLFIQMYWPVSPGSCRNFSIFLDQPGNERRLLSHVAHGLIRMGGAPFIRRILSEDAAIYPSIQQGTSCPDRPYGGGLISTREERIFAFQDRILAAYDQQ